MLLVQFSVVIVLLHKLIQCALSNADSSNIDRTKNKELRYQFSKVNDFECIFLDFNVEAGMNCSFNQPIDSDPDNRTSYYLRHWSAEVNCQCPDKLSNQCRMQCSLRAGQFDKFRNQYVFTLRMEGGTGSRSETIAVNRSECMVLEQPGIEVAVLNRTCSSICLQWSNKRKDNHNYDVAWELHLQPHTRISWDAPRYARLKETLCLKGLPYAGHEYEMKLRRRINVTRGHWSDYFNYTFRTEPEAYLASKSAKLTLSVQTLVYIISCIFQTV